jgi:hypothetical protein
MRIPSARSARSGGASEPDASNWGEIQQGRDWATVVVIVLSSFEPARSRRAWSRDMDIYEAFYQ